MTKHEIVSVDDILAQGCTEVKSKKGRKGYVIGDEVVAVECTECNSLKYRRDFSRNKGRFLGMQSSCDECRRERDQKRYESNPEKVKEFSRKWKQANPEKAKESRRKWREANPEYHSEYQRKHYEANPEMYLLKDQRRRARKASLPDDLTAEQQADINATFGNACALTGEPTDLHLDHVIPLSIGHGGTTYGNMIPLSAELNLSKNASHIFEWFEANKERFNLSQRNFDALIEYLAQANEMTTQEYRTYVNYCFDNPRDVGELQDAV